MSFTALVVVVWLQWPLDRELLAIEDARMSAEPLIEALKDGGSRALQAIRALGRFERPELSAHVVPFLEADDETIRIEAANALAQMSADEALAPFLMREKSLAVRSALYEAIGRLDEADEALFIRGLSEPEPARLGAAKGLESYLRLRNRRPSASATSAIETVLNGASAKTKRLLLLSLLRAEAPAERVLEAALRDPDPQVRRLAVMGLAEYRDDPSYLVRYAALRAGFTCEHGLAALEDESQHVVLLAIEQLGEAADCDDAAPRLEKLASGDDWRRASRALVALAKVRPELARRLLPRFISHPTWQARVYVAEAAKALNAEDALETLREDAHPNVSAAALTTPDEAFEMLSRRRYAYDYGFLVRALPMLEGYESPGAIETYLDVLRRVSSDRRHTSRDPRRLLLERLRESGVDGDSLSFLLDDFDPAIAALASEISGRPAATEHFAPGPVATEAELERLQGTRARITMKEAGPFVIELLPEIAPLTSAQFARLAASGYYDGLTFHRIVPNFVLQGGSPGANEYVGRPEYLRDEVGLVSHERGTLGISTRGRDTGDSQIFINLVDNYRLDHNYTVFARIVEGMENVDRVQEGDLMERVEIF